MKSIHSLILSIFTGPVCHTFSTCRSTKPPIRSRRFPFFLLLTHPPSNRVQCKNNPPLSAE
ncbi:hypothetical protein PF005_g18590 [Phytophthora fragariae]|uniref:RxLR effector protein n=1 Tax=Phytophthora fragariae TaxID=53985 RepID=A0A6A3JMQ8_9STRA|nr:hypothetical protein PF003_g27107 [Phytophthora fragariae]KAE8932851.1 hypothetical protein PF009_g17131 [Phytophthora fragariae]KAE8993695.1 hypothetical protein PF011_g17041 [Phytophthora fragariae]KAE9093116.1 hypothetical protein PF007_g18234 [Phytophthora fragariae]KAE9129386.1 hypothetical protein PF006_g16023 [Phytophthora fragariae]